jgi:hypothetical protein
MIYFYSQHPDHLPMHGPEIRQLDSERQSLVYNHHHELIAASDTIAAVNTSSRQK